MTQIIGIGGEPATGKTTLFRELLNRLGPQQDFEFGLLEGHLFPEDEVIVLGTYDGEQHDGTDALAMTVITDTREFLELAAEHEEYASYTVLFEGDRLFNGSFIESVRATNSVEGAFVVLQAPVHVLDERHAARGTADTQDDTWLQGRRTKYENVLDEHGPPTDGDVEPTEDVPLYTREHADTSDTDALVTELLAHAERSGPGGNDAES